MWMLLFEKMRNRERHDGDGDCEGGRKEDTSAVRTLHITQARTFGLVETEEINKYGRAWAFHGVALVFEADEVRVAFQYFEETQ